MFQNRVTHYKIVRCYEIIPLHLYNLSGVKKTTDYVETIEKQTWIKEDMAVENIRCHKDVSERRKGRISLSAERFSLQLFLVV